MVVHAYNPQHSEGEARDQEFKANLSYIENLRPAWAT